MSTKKYLPKSVTDLYLGTKLARRAPAIKRQPGWSGTCATDAGSTWITDGRVLTKVEYLDRLSHKSVATLLEPVQDRHVSEEAFETVWNDAVAGVGHAAHSLEVVEHEVFDKITSVVVVRHSGKVVACFDAQRLAFAARLVSGDDLVLSRRLSDRRPALITCGGITAATIMPLYLESFTGKAAEPCTEPEPEPQVDPSHPVVTEAEIRESFAGPVGPLMICTSCGDRDYRPIESDAYCYACPNCDEPTWSSAEELLARGELEVAS